MCKIREVVRSWDAACVYAARVSRSREYDLTALPILAIPGVVFVALFLGIRGPQLEIWSMTFWTFFFLAG
jgi:hypothetical protein